MAEQLLNLLSNDRWVRVVPREAGAALVGSGSITSAGGTRTFILALAKPDEEIYAFQTDTSNLIVVFTIKVMRPLSSVFTKEALEQFRATSAWHERTSTARLTRPDPVQLSSLRDLLANKPGDRADDIHRCFACHLLVALRGMGVLDRSARSVRVRV